jgi:small Trp-rich protein
MAFVLLGFLVLALHLLDIGPMANWNFQLFGDLWKFCVPFACAAVWWAIADSTGWTKKREMNKMEERKVKRRESQMEALGLGLGKTRDRAATKAREGKARVASADPRRREEPPAPAPAAGSAGSRKEPKL